jgi:hypothetical protein
LTDTTPEEDPKRYWTQELRRFLPGLLEEHPILSKFHQQASVIFYGSTTMGIDDEFSDLDLWFLLSADDLRKLDAAGGTRFFEIKVDGKPGHLTAEAAEEFAADIHQCHMDKIYQLREAEIMTDHTGTAVELVQVARRPMPKNVSEAFFFYHYVEMRGEHRSCDNPIERADPAALLLAMAKTITHAMRAAMVLHHQPYPYDKWLHRAAMATPTGRQVGAIVDRICNLLATDALHLQMSQHKHPINVELMGIRQVLIQSAEENGIRDEASAMVALHGPSAGRDQGHPLVSTEGGNGWRSETCDKRRLTAYRH